MEDYRWTDHQAEPFALRYPDRPWVAGRGIWMDGIANQAFAQRRQADSWLERIRTATAPARSCPRLFVSHRQIDTPAAFRLAWLAWDEGWDYWLDLIDLDPTRNAQRIALERSLRRPLRAFELAVLTAAIIEMALLNSTHLIAAMTRNTAGSQWVPYEFGRKRETFFDETAACWWDSSSLALPQLPEYVHLALVHRHEADIRKWLQRERAKHYAGCTRINGVWPDDVPAALPGTSSPALSTSA